VSVHVTGADLALEAVLDPQGVQDREENDRDRKREAAARRTWLINSMQHPEGRKWFKELIDRTRAFETRFASINGYARDDMGTWFLAGQQKVGWGVWEELDEADPVLASRLRRGL
jgi:hypothetical protein